MMARMKNANTNRLVGFAALSCILFLISPAAAAEVGLSSGITVTAPEGGRNQILITVGNDLLAVDAAVKPAQSEQGPRFALATGAVEWVFDPRAIELIPEARQGNQEAARSASITFRTGFTIGTAAEKIVFLTFGRAATASDAAVWMPQTRTLITGRICDRSTVAATAQSDTIAWAGVLRQFLDLEPEIVIPGHGAPGGPELLSDQLDRLIELRSRVEADLLAGRSNADSASSYSAPWFAAWRKDAPHDADRAYRSVFNEVGGLVPPWELIEERKLREGPSPTRDDEGWTKPTRVLWRNYWPERLPMLAAVAPGVEIVPFESNDDALTKIDGADALIGTATAELLAAGKSLRWAQVGAAGVERYLAIPQLKDGTVLLTNGQRMASKMIGEHVMALTRALARGINRAVAAQTEGTWKRSEIGNSAPLTGLRGKTMLVVGLGGIGTEVARLADGAGMRVTAIRNSRRVGPPFVDKVGLGEDLPAYLREADVVVNCLPMTPDTEDTFNAALFAAMKPSAFFVNVGRGGTVDTDALVSALENGDIAGAGLDVTDPEPLPDGHPLWKAPNLVITPHFAAWSDEDNERRWLLYRENLRRFVAGERLLSVVDPVRGY